MRPVESPCWSHAKVRNNGLATTREWCRGRAGGQQSDEHMGSNKDLVVARRFKVR